MPEPDYHADERRLLEETIPAIEAFAAEHCNEVFRYFAFDCNPCYGEVLLCLDTEENSVAEAKKHEQYVTKQRRDKLLYDDAGWLEWAITVVANRTTGPVLPFNNNTGDFDHQGFADIRFPTWEAFTLEDDYPGTFEQSEVDYLNCKVAVLFSHAIDALVERDAFSCLNRTSPFFVGLAFHDHEQLVVRMTNW